MLRSEINIHMITAPAYCVLLIACIFISACLTTENLDLLKQDVNKLNSDSLLMKSELNNIKEKISESASEGSLNQVRQNQAEMQSVLSNISRDLQVLSGRFDENKYFTEKTLKESGTERELIKTQVSSIEGQIKDIRERLNVLENQIKQQKETPKEQQKAEEPKKESQEVPPQPQPLSKPKDKITLYEQAYDVFKKKNYQEAREKFDAFIKEFPKEDLTDNAQFWIAETYYGEKDYEGAILAYEALLKKYPHSEKTPSALLKQGFSFIEIGDKKTGRILLEQVIERHPDLREAELAKKKLGEIDNKAKKKK